MKKATAANFLTRYGMPVTSTSKHLCLCPQIIPFVSLSCGENIVFFVDGCFCPDSASVATENKVTISVT